MKTTMDTTMTDFKMTASQAWPDDITYCATKDCTAGCFRKACNIDWELPKHKYYGASMADFGPVCTSYKAEGEKL